ncbi:MAG: radical SAM protein [Candidatus Gastranaerophilales bacterium]|nr:radical SAM protein [Candidatus Gastranaerophilales bacterium]
MDNLSEQTQNQNEDTCFDGQKEENDNKKVFKSCELIEHGFMVDNSNSVRVCSIITEHDGRPILYKDYTGEIFDKEEFFAKKWEHRKLTREGSYPYECEGCPMLVEREWDDEDYIDNVLFAHWVDCNSRCIYCGATTDEFVRANYRYYDFTPAIREMIKNGSLIRTAKIDFAGGEPTVYPEFEELLTLFLTEGFNNLFVNTSGIKYSPSIRNALRNNQITLTISLDAGTKDMHKKIKRVNSFDKVWKNIREYSKAQQEAGTKEKICLKYILIPEVNVIKKEIDIFFEKVTKEKIDHVALSLDMFWWEKHKDDDNTELVKMAQYFVDKANEYGYKLHIYPWARWLLGMNW